MEKTSNNSWSVCLEEKLLKKIYQVRWRAVAVLVQLSKKSETVLPHYIIQEEQQLILRLQLAVVLLVKLKILIQRKMEVVVVVVVVLTAKRQMMKSNLENS